MVMQKLQRITGVKGMNDLLPVDAALWQWFESKVRHVLSLYGYQEIRTPIVEPSILFKRGVGDATDIVEKEMYSFIDGHNQDSLSLRPEGTAAVVRAAIEHNLLRNEPKRLWYGGPMFRHERPQRGRYRQFHQIGLEALGFAGPSIDAEVILISAFLWKVLNIDGLTLEINCLGSMAERMQHRVALVQYFEKNIHLLDEDSQRRLIVNPLRLLDTKNPDLIPLMESAPKLIDYLGTKSLSHFDEVKTILCANQIEFVINHRLVRGLDYYNLTVFEWTTKLLGAQGTVAGGGRYDSLIEQLGGLSTPACGFAMGVERLIELIKNFHLSEDTSSCDIYFVYQCQNCLVKATQLAQMLRANNYRVIVHASADGQTAKFKTQLKRADTSGARFAIILGEDELKNGTVSIKSLRNKEVVQQIVALDKIIDCLKALD